MMTIVLHFSRRAAAGYIAAALTALLIGGLAPATAQDTIQNAIRQRTGMTITSAELMRRLQESGLSREQVRQRLRQAGYDPNLADRYFDELAKPDSVRAAAARVGITQTLPQPNGNLLAAMASIGLIPPGSQLPDSLDERAGRRFREPRDSLLAKEPQIFGKDLFSATTTVFQPILAGPVDPDYKLGPDDEITLIVTGDVELGYDLKVTREGWVVIPEVGQVQVAGLTLAEAKRLMNSRLATAYSGIRTGAATSDVSVGRLRRNVVTITGDVEIQGNYPVSGGATVFNALYVAGGPSENGSFRNITVRRANRPIATVDLYDYLLRGDKGGDVRLEQGDLIFVPVVGRRVTVYGSVRRPAIFELKPNETLSDVLTFAGGVQAEAALERILIDRIVPAGERQPGKERTMVDVTIAQLRSGPVPLEDGDQIHVFAITTERRNRLRVTGDVHAPGLFEYRPGMTALELIEKASGLLPTAFTPSAQIVRLNPADSTTSIVRVAFDDPNAPNYAGRIILNDLDEMVVFGRAKLINPDSVQIFGLVKREGAYPFSSGLSVQDLVLQAGGFREGAQVTQAEVARRRGGAGVRGDTLASSYRVPLNLPINGNAPGQRVDEFELAPGDQVFIRAFPGFVPLQTVEVLGEVVYPGPYTVESDNEKISRLIRRAGGLTPQAYARGLQVIRSGKQVAVNLPAALARPDGPDDLTIRPGDRLTVPKYDPLVLVTGAVAFESLVRYEEGLGVDDYLQRAGGPLPEADKGRISVRAPNGELRTTRSVLSVKRYPQVEPGSVINVPVEPESQGANWDQFLTRSLSLVSTLATLILAARALR